MGKVISVANQKGGVAKSKGDAAKKGTITIAIWYTGLIT